MSDYQAAWIVDSGDEVGNEGFYRVKISIGISQVDTLGTQRLEYWSIIRAKTDIEYY